jgi:hypothetical protein
MASSKSPNKLPREQLSADDSRWMILGGLAMIACSLGGGFGFLLTHNIGFVGMGVLCGGLILFTAHMRMQKRGSR